MMSATAIIETDQLTKRYGPARRIDELSIAVEPGEA
jgi:ABC-type multidrug transport system ATPase subunit